MEIHNVHAVVLAAGKSTRFGTGESKQLVPLCGVPMVMHSIEVLYSLDIATTVVLGHQATDIEEFLQTYKSGRAVSVVYQSEQRGTGDAVQCSENTWMADHVLILYGDMPLITQEIISSLLYRHVTGNFTLTFCTTKLDDPTGYGRVLADKTGTVLIREDKECGAKEREMCTVNAGIYVVRRDFLSKSLRTLAQSEATGEFYLTDVVADAGNQGKKVGMYEVSADVVRGVNTLEELAVAEQLLYQRIRQRWLHHGVRLIDPPLIHIERNVRIGSGSVIGSGVQLRGNTVIGKRVHIDPYCVLTDAIVEDDAVILSHSVITNSTVAVSAQVGPFVHLRTHAVVSESAQIGNFVEMKNTHMGAYSKAKHLSYLGDATIGKNVNVGAGTITCNYDGCIKHKTVIKDGAMIGANSSLVAPVTVEEQSYVAAGSTITRDVPALSLGIGRARQENKLKWGHGRVQKNSVTPARSVQTKEVEEK